jgi:hypothetical protein
MHTAETNSEDEMATEKLRYKSPGTDQILAEFIKARGKTYSEIHELILFGIRNSCHSSKRNLLLCLFIKRDKTNCNYYLKVSFLSTSYKILSNILSMLTPYVDEISMDHQCGFSHYRSMIRFIC